MLPTSFDIITASQRSSEEDNHENKQQRSNFLDIDMKKKGASLLQFRRLAFFSLNQYDGLLEFGSLRSARKIPQSRLHPLYVKVSEIVEEMGKMLNKKLWFIHSKNCCVSSSFGKTKNIKYKLLEYLFNQYYILHHFPPVVMYS